MIGWLTRWRSGATGAERAADGSARGTPRADAAGSAWTPLRVTALALPPLCVVALHLVIFPPGTLPRGVALRTGAVASDDLRAPFTFYAPRSQAELEAERRQAARDAEPVYRMIPGIDARVLARLDAVLEQAATLSARDDLSPAARAKHLRASAPELSAAEAQSLTDTRQGAASRRVTRRAAEEVLAGGYADLLPSGRYGSVRVVDPATGDELARAADHVVDAAHRSERLAALASERQQTMGGAVASQLVLEALRPNLAYDEEASDARRRAAGAQVVEDREIGLGELIVAAGTRVTQQQHGVLEALQEETVRRGRVSGSGATARRVCGRVLMVLLILGGILYLTARAQDRRVVRARQGALISAVLGLFLVLAALVKGRAGISAAAMPVALPAMLGTVLLGESNGLRVALGAVLLLLVAPAAAAPVAVVWVAIAVASVRSIRRVRHRNQFYKAMAVVALASAGAVTALTLANGSPDVRREVAQAVLSAFASTVLALFLLPMFEALFGVTTELTLLELSDLNHPLLRRMALESPGTFHHSQVVGQLAQAGAHAIGANSLLARVGASYHDIGKMLKPRYYVENQSGENAHDDLTPSMSALVIAAHVRDGVELGRQWGLPAAVTDFIPEHHGTMVMQYFYHKALERDDGAAVSVDDFRYPGPRPRSRETAIVMLADGAEAASRSLRRPTPSRIREMTRKVFERRMGEGELDACGLTLAEVAKVREAFVPILVSIHHERVPYPGQSAHEDRKEQEGIEAHARARRRGAGLASGG